MKALLIIDMQQVSFTAETPCYDTDGVVERINSLATKFRGNGDFVIYIQHDGSADDFCKPGSEEWSVVDQFAAGGIDNNEKLEIYADGTFKGDTWGQGTWNLEHRLKGTRIDFTFNNEGYNTYFYRRMFFSKPRIVIFRDLNSEFLKD